MSAPPANVLDTVVKHNFCCSCGMCAAVCPSRNLRMTETEHGEYRPEPTGSCADSCRLCLEVCPFSNEHGQDEDTLGLDLFGSESECTHDDALGWVRDTYVGGLANETERLKAPSGGLATAVLCQLLRDKEIDAAVVLHPMDERPWYGSVIAETEEEVLSSRGSVYHVAPFDDVLHKIATGPERSHAVVALPCAAKAIRLAQKRMPSLRRRIRYVLGLTCGGYRSLLFADLLTALMGRSTGRLRYRSKRYCRTSRDYRAEIEANGSVRSVRMLGLFGYLWVNEVGGLQSCQFCDDVFAETADATFMDAWLPEYRADRRGTNLVVSRNAKLSGILESFFEAGTCEGGPIDAEKIRQSQSELLENRRNLLAPRCELAEETLGYAPKKRLALCSAHDRQTQQAEARRQWGFFVDVRGELLRFRRRSKGKPGWLRRWRAWRLCWKVLLIARRHGVLSRTFRASKHLSPRAASSE